MEIQKQNGGSSKLFNLMHIYFMTRGIKHDTERFINELASSYLPLKTMNPQTGQMEDAVIQTAVRPIQLYELVFPEEHKDLMLNTLFDLPEGKSQHKKHHKVAWALRKALGVEPIPKTWDKSKKIPIYGFNVEKIGIGIKGDYWVKDGKIIPKKEEGAFEGL